MSLFDIVSHWLGRVEIALAFADQPLREGEEALRRGEPLRAEAAAKEVLARVPGSPLALALLADAREASGRLPELREALEELAKRVPSRGEVWTRLGAARRALGEPTATVRETYVRALGVAAPGSESRREALLALCDLDLEEGDFARAEMWLAGLAPNHMEVALRQGEILLARGDAEAALRELDRVPSADATDGRHAFARARALSAQGSALAFAPAIRAYLLDVPGASALLSSALAWIPTDEVLRERVRGLIEAQGEQGHARWRAAFARAEGRRDEARAALREALAGGDQSAALPLLEAAIDDRDAAALHDALAGIPKEERAPLAREAAALESALALPDDAPPEVITQTVEELSRIESARAEPFATELLARTLGRLVPTAGTSRWGAVLQRLEADARNLHDLEDTARVAAIATLTARPVRLAIVGEFNAGKSTFVNALIGQDVAPTGVLPTTGTLHHLRYGPDPLARIELESDAAFKTRIVPLPDLRKTLSEIGEESVRGVEIELPLPFLTRVEVLDTPGFNAPSPRHTEAARRALEEADVLLWLLDASQPLKQSERIVLEEARAAHIPVQIFIGKSDRIAEAQRPAILDLVQTALKETGIASLTPPLLFSARLALAGKLGQEGALESSNWAAVQKTLDEDVIAKSETLKERALRRRARTVTLALLARANEQATAEEAAAQAAVARTRALAAAAARIERDEASIVAALARALEAPEAALERDLSLTEAAPAADTDGTLLRYRTERALGRLTPTLAAALAGIAESPGLGPRELSALSRTLVRTAATAARPPIREPLARAAVLALADHLRTLAVVEAPAPSRAPLQRELLAWSAALA